MTLFWILTFGAAVAGVAATLSATLAERALSQGVDGSIFANQRNVHGYTQRGSVRQRPPHGNFLDLLASSNARIRGRGRAAGAILVAAAGVLVASATTAPIIVASAADVPPQVSPQLPPELAGGRADAGSRNTVFATPEGPKGCSGTYRVHGEVIDPPPDGRALWIMWLSDGEGQQDRAFFTGRRIGDIRGPYDTRVAVDTSSGLRMYTFMLISVDAAGDTKLQSASRMDANPGMILNDLPSGSTYIFETGRHRQLCG